MSFQSQQFCQQICKNSKSSFAQSFTFLPKNQKRSMFALYAFCRLVDDIADELAKINFVDASQQLEKFHEIIENIFNNNNNKIKIFEDNNYAFIAEELTFAINNFSLEKIYFLDLLEGMRFDLRINSKNANNANAEKNTEKNIKNEFFYENLQLENYCYQVAGTVGMLSSAIFGYQKNSEEIPLKNYALNLGLALQFTNILRDVKEDFDNQRIYLLVDKINLPENFSEISWKIFENALISQNILENHAKNAEKYFQLAFTNFKKLSPQTQQSQQPAIIMAGIYRQLLKEIIKKKYNIFTNKQHFRLSTMQKFWIVSQIMLSPNFVLNDAPIFKI